MGLIRRTLLGDGRLADGLRTELTNEKLLLIEEGLPGSITYRNYRTLEVVAESPEKVCIAYDPAAFNPQMSGRVELRLRTASAARIVALLSR